MSPERVPPEEADLPDDVQYGESVQRVWQRSNGEWWGEDEHGEFHLNAGSPTPVSADKDDLPYEPCNCVLKYTFERYGERRYCTGMAGSNFGLDFDTCKHHKARHNEEFMKKQAEMFKHGATAASHESIYEYMPPHQRIEANEMYKSLLDESKYTFDADVQELHIDVSDHPFAGDVDTLVMEHPIPTERITRGKALWFAALDFIRVESMTEEQFREAMAEENVNAVGETWTVVASGENGPVYDTDEHHLNLPISRIQKDYRRHLEFGGVITDGDGDGDVLTEREWVVEFVPDEDERMAPEAKQSEHSALTDVSTPEDSDDQH